MSEDIEVEPGEFEERKPRVLMAREAAFAYETEDRPRDHLQVVPRSESQRGEASPARKRGTKMKTSVYLEPGDLSHLAWVAGIEQRSQAEIIRDAIRAYSPRRAASERRFSFFDSGEGDGRSIADIPEDELMRGFGADAWSDGVGDNDR